MDPRFRLHRKYPGEQIARLRRLGVRLVDRDKPLKPPREVLGSLIRAGAFSSRDNRAKVDPAPNAPLLKRLVLFPYRQDTTFPRRAPQREPVPWDMLAREALPTMAERIAERPRSTRESLVKDAMVRVVRRERPSLDAWLEGRR